VEQPSWFEQHRGLVIGIGLALVVLLAAAVWAVVAMVNNPAQTETIRDIFIVFMALEALVIGVALVVLVVQVALLTNLLRHEVKPILDSTQETARTLRGTATFISQNLVDPVIKMQSSVAAVKSVLDLLRPNNRS
jgi:ABC-type spermidine/putrescine transport system permease subunit II